MKISYRTFGWIIGAIVGSASIIIAYQLKESDRTLINFVILFGTALSFIGLLITFVQIKSVKQTSEETNVAVTQTIDKLNTVFTIFDISKASHIIQSAQNYLRDNRTELAYFKMKDLKEFLIQIRHLSDLDVFNLPDAFQEIFQSFMIDLNNVNLVISNTGKSINKGLIIDNLEGLSTELTKIENTLKYKELYGS